MFRTAARRELRAVATALVLSAVTAAPGAAETKVVVSIKPVHALVARVMEGLGTPALLVSGSASPHTYAMKPSDAKALNNAEVFFRVSEQIEPFTGKVVKSLPDTVRVVTLAEAPGLALLDKRTGETFEAHIHGGHDEHDEPRANGTVRDGHVWLDPENAKAMVAAIVKVLIEAAPQDADKLQANAARLIAEIGTLQTEIERELAPIKGRPFVVFHDATQYFERCFGLTALGSITVSPDVQPSAKRLTEIRAKLSKLDTGCVFAEPGFSPALVATVTEGTRARSGTLDPEGLAIKAGPGAYFELMRSLASGLKACLQPGN